MKTVICHFYNEEYLLPWWLKHSKKIFDHGIMLNNGSTDNSVEVIKSICPTWKIVNTSEPWFDAQLIDQEVQQIEATVEGWKTCLNVTEFLLGDLDSITNSSANEHYISSIQLYDWNPEGTLDPNKDIWEQVILGVDPRQHLSHRMTRAFHRNPQMHYTVGRHFGHKTTEDVVIIHVTNCISSPEMLARRLQIQHKIRAADRARGFGVHHYNWGAPEGLTAEAVHQYMLNTWNLVSDCSEYINKLTK